jgi:hypothetical protein
MGSKLMLCCLTFIYSGVALAQWDVSTIQTLGNSCSISSSQVDDAKLTLVFGEFSAELPPQSARGVFEESECRVSVRFIVPPQSQLKSMTHRVFAGIEKDASTEVSLKVSMRLGALPFELSGFLPSGAAFSDEVLLYRAFGITSALGCSPQPQEVEVQLKWKLKVMAVHDQANGRISLSGGTRWSDTWIETQPCGG